MFYYHSFVSHSLFDLSFYLCFLSCHTIFDSSISFIHDSYIHYHSMFPSHSFLSLSLSIIESFIIIIIQSFIIVIIIIESFIFIQLFNIIQSVIF